MYDLDNGQKLRTNRFIARNTILKGIILFKIGNFCRIFKSFQAKEYRIVCQCLPFLAMHLDLPENYKEVCRMLATLSVYAESWERLDIEEVRPNINRLVAYLAIFFRTSQSRSKTHMLLHAVDSLELFGPCPVYNVQTFESLNKICRGL